MKCDRGLRRAGRRVNRVTTPRGEPICMEIVEMGVEALSGGAI